MNAQTLDPQDGDGRRAADPMATGEAQLASDGVAPTVGPETRASEPPRSASPGLPDVVPLVPGDIAVWVQKGWADFVAAPVIGLFYGGCFAVMGLLIAWTFVNSPQWTLALCAGFLLIGPFLAIGLYSASRARENGRPCLLADSLVAWDRNVGALVLYLGAIMVLEMLWSRSALVIFAVSFNTMPSATGTLALILDPENIGFVVTYVGVGAIFAGLIFATSVISIPMIMDRDTDGISAAITSIRVCLRNPVTMFLWGAVITLLVVLSMPPFFLGLVVVGPVIGHASWHAYRQAVEADPGAHPRADT
ncbi:MAG: DUF2189 domain-containing protein [Burkholderiaceae bacterium]